MPELPEVETLCRQLNGILPGKRIRKVEILDLRLGKVEGLTGKRVRTVSRRGKFIEIELEGGLKAALHLRMSGRLLWQTDLTSLPPHSRWVLSFAAGRLVCIDPRRFATFCVQEQESVPPPIPNPLAGLPAGRLLKIARTRRLPVKSFLMDQRVIAGIGNIYACEILHEAAVDPRRPASALTLNEWRRAGKAAALILKRAVSCRGTTVSDWRDLFGCSGTNQDHLRVYARKGESCLRCGGVIEREVLQGRGAWFCPSCQK
jgi:formamidopyrimidine-DNA glycosylase